MYHCAWPTWLPDVTWQKVTWPEVCSAHARKWVFPALFSGVFGYFRGFSLCCVVLLGYFLSRPRSHFGKMIRGKQVTLQTILKEHKEFWHLELSSILVYFCILKFYKIVLNRRVLFLILSGDVTYLTKSIRWSPVCPLICKRLFLSKYKVLFAFVRIHLVKDFAFILFCLGNSSTSSKWFQY